MVSMILTTVAVLVATGYLVATLIQVRKTAKEMENLAHVLNAASPLINMIFMGGNLFSAITERVIKFFGSKTKGGTK
jgi:hypothetical protein